jgi:hypothetical protein
MNVRYYFERSDAGFQQLKNAGGLRLIHDPEIIKAIQAYEQLIATVNQFEVSEMEANNEYRNANALVLDINVVLQMNASNLSNYNNFIQPTNNPPLLSYDRDRLNQLMSTMHNVDRVNYVVMHFENKLKKEAEALMSVIDKAMKH